MASIASQFPKIAARMANRQTQKFAEKVIPESKTKMDKMKEVVAAMDKKFEKQSVSDVQKAGKELKNIKIYQTPRAWGPTKWDNFESLWG